MDDDKTTQQTPFSGHAQRAAFIVDACAYFHAFTQAVRRAKRSVLILGWDIDSRIRLGENGQGPRLYELLNQCVEERPEMHVHVLVWDFPLAYSMDREPLQSVNFPRKTHANIHFHMDDELPVGSSHHQKVVVVDDKIAFVGGMDLTSARWDRPDHYPEDPDRVRPGGEPYGPYHDVQMVVDGEPAARLGDMARDRWQWATGHAPKPPGEVDGDPWPPTVEPDLQDFDLTVALTLPPFKGRPGHREVERLYLDQIAEARKTIYLENQYFTSTTVRDALARRLREADGPEVLIVLPRMTTGLLEQLVMEPLQSDVLDQLAGEDAHGRLSVYCPFADEDGETSIKVHTKLMIADDQFLTIGSANLNERSMGLDSECNLALKAPEGTPESGVLRAFRQRLMAHHLGLPIDDVTENEERAGMLGAVRELRREARRLVPERDTRNQDALPVDPEVARRLDTSRPGLYDAILDDYTSPDNSRTSFLRLSLFGAVLAGFIALALAWRFTPLSEYANPDSLLHWAEQVRQVPLAPLAAVLCFVVGGFVLFPVTLLIVLTASIFAPLWALAISLGGCVLSAMTVYGLGRILGHRTIKRLAGSRVHALSRQLGRHGLGSIVAVRIVPVAPYSIVNLMAGASHIRPSTFLLGTVVGMAPGIVAMTLFGSQLMNALRDPGTGTLLVLAAVVLAVVVLGAVLRRRLSRMRDDKEKTS
ncbi:VTT domain-containing protein [uncultured Pseudodesulfovibrio sp.]|uniref:VTT domain-containing protein n=1 Tax=uncultured Pseudodesulfovibrio sp. TaxID=2035858 RepID=UPI0029C95339|nr:VTT domain-containing protein [uncultured Pseudodesulfovibrio sp.]